MGSQLNYALSDDQVTELFKQYPEKDLTEIKCHVREKVDDFVDEEILEDD